MLREFGFQDPQDGHFGALAASHVDDVRHPAVVHPAPTGLGGPRPARTRPACPPTGREACRSESAGCSRLGDAEGET